MAKRDQWSSNLGFLLAAIGSAVGLGNIWRFPYVAYENGGGAFLIPYFIALFTAGIPILMLEFALGHKKQASSPKAFKRIDTKWEWIGWWSVLFVMFGIVAYYIVVIGWTLNYFIFSFTQKWGADTNDFFFHKFLKVSSGPWDIQGINWSILIAVAIVWIINWFITYRGIKKGIEGTLRILMPILLVISVGIVIYSITLDGALTGIKQYVTPDFTKMGDIKVWVAAYSQIFFSLSLGFGIMIAYSSYLPKKANIFKNSLIVGFSNSFYEVFAGFGVFSVLGYMAVKQSKEVSEVVTSGIGLAFVAYPTAISILPGGTIFGILFFFLLSIAGISSSVSIIEAFTSAIIDKFGYKRKNIVTIISIIGVLLSILFVTNAGLFWLDIVDHFLNQYGLLTVGILEAGVIGWFYKTEKLKIHILDNLGLYGVKHKFFKHFILQIWMYSIKFITPVALGIAIIYSLIKELKTPYGGYPVSAIIILGVGWLLITHFIAFSFSGFSWKKDTIEE